MICMARSLGAPDTVPAGRPAGPGQRWDRHRAVLDPHQALRGTADQAEVAVIEVEQEWARVDRPEHPVDVERLRPRLNVDPLAGDHLEDVARLDVLLAMADD